MIFSIAENLPNKDILYHKGIVVDNKDPKNLGRIKVLVEGRLHVSSKNYDRLPWVFPNNTGRSGGRVDSGSFSVPEIRSEVKVSFLNDDPYTAVYEGTWETSSLHANELWEDESSYGWIDSIIQWFVVNKNKRLNQFFRAITGDLVEIDKNGNVSINISGSLLLNVEKDIKIKAKNRVEKYDSINYNTSSYNVSSNNYNIDVSGSYYRTCSTANILPDTRPSRGSASSANTGSLDSDIREMEEKISSLKDTATMIKERSNKLNKDVLKTGIKGDWD